MLALSKLSNNRKSRRRPRDIIFRTRLKYTLFVTYEDASIKMFRKRLEDV